MNRRSFAQLSLQLFGWTTLGASFNGCTHDTVIRSLLLNQDAVPPTVLAGTMLELYWEAIGVREVLLEHSIDGGQSWSLVAAGLSAYRERFDWEIPSLPTTDNLLRLSDAEAPDLFAISTSFAIQPTLVLPLASLLTDIENSSYALVNLSGLGGVYILPNAGDGYTILSPTCPHLSCEVSYSPGPETFNCPCHGSSFSRLGCLENGPAEEGLTAYSNQYFSNPDRLIILPDSGRPACP